MEQTQQNPQKTQFPTEEVTLPSKGLLYPEGSPLKKGVIEMKYMTAREEDILTNQNYIQNGTVIDKLLQSLIITSCDYNEILVGDKNAIMVAARILGYGSDYDFNYYNPKTKENEEVKIDLTTIEDKELDESLIKNGRNEFDFTLPSTKILVTFKLLTHGDERKIASEIRGLKKINKKSNPEISTRMKHIITSVNGDRESKSIRDFVDISLLARDARALRKYIRKIAPDTNLVFNFEGDGGYTAEDVDIPIGANFFWPDATI